MDTYRVGARIQAPQPQGPLNPDECTHPQHLRRPGKNGFAIYAKCMGCTRMLEWVRRTDTPQAKAKIAKDEAKRLVREAARIRKEGKNVRDAFRNAVDRAIKQIDKYDKPLAQHLKDSIKHGNEAVYRPGTSITWDVRPIVNT